MSAHPETFNQALLTALESYGDRACFEIKEDKSYKQISYRRFQALTFRLAHYFRQQGLAHGQPVAIMAHNSLEWMVAYTACLLAGGTAVIFRHSRAKEAVAHILQDTGARIVVVDDSDQAHFILDSLAEFSELPSILVIGEAGPLPPRATGMAKILSQPLTYDQYRAVQTMAAGLEPEALAAIHYTAGETGKPKGAVFTQQQRLQTMRAMQQWLTFDDEELAFTVLSWGWAASLDISLHYFLSGIPNALPQRLESMLDNMRETSPTVMLITPLLLERFYNEVVAGMHEAQQAVFRWAIGISKKYRNAGDKASKELRDQYARANSTFFTKIKGRIGGRLQRVYLTGAPLPQRLVDFALAIDLEPLSVYSLTEAGGFPAVSTPTAHRPDSCGQAAPGFQLRLTVDKELLVKSNTLMQGYWRQPEATARVINEAGWLQSGDLARIDRDNYLYIVGRSAGEEQFTLTSGHKIAPAKIEQALMESPLIHQAAVFGAGRQYVSALIVPDLEELVNCFRDEPAEPAAGQRSRPPLKWYWHQENEQRRLVATNAHPNVQITLDGVIRQVNHTLDRWERIRAYRLLEQSNSAVAQEFAALMPAGRRELARLYAAQIEAMYPRSTVTEELPITQVQIPPERLHQLLEKKNILDAWLADAGIGFLFDLARRKQIDMTSMVHICDIVASIAQMENEEKPLSTAFIVGDPVKIARILPSSSIRLLRRDHIRRMRNNLVALAPLVDGLALGYVVDPHGVVRGIRRLEVELETEGADLLFGPQFRFHAALSKRCEAVVFFVPSGGRQVRVFVDGRLVGRYSDGDWTPENIRHAANVIDELARLEFNPALVRRLLRCAFLMSEQNMGAIFILGDAEAVLTRSDAPEISYFAIVTHINVDELSDRELINFARQDGATIIDASGQFSGCMILLRPDAATKAEVAPGKGARHTSAAKMSAETRCVAITVSQDGPITIYHHGKRLISL